MKQRRIVWLSSATLLLFAAACAQPETSLITSGAQPPSLSPHAAQLAREARVLPVYYDGEIAAFEFTKIHPESRWAAFGLLEGDRVVSIGELYVEAPMDFLELLELAAGTPELFIRVPLGNGYVALELPDRPAP